MKPSTRPAAALHANPSSSKDWLVGGRWPRRSGPRIGRRPRWDRWGPGRRACAPRSAWFRRPTRLFRYRGGPGASRSTTTAIGPSAATNIPARWVRTSESAGRPPFRSSARLTIRLVRKGRLSGERADVPRPLRFSGGDVVHLLVQSDSDESGGVGGIFEPVTDMTAQMLSTRRARDTW